MSQLQWQRYAHVDVDHHVIESSLFCVLGFCRYCHKCRFAHGEAELRPVTRHKKYKTEICKVWLNSYIWILNCLHLHVHVCLEFQKNGSVSIWAPLSIPSWFWLVRVVICFSRFAHILLCVSFVLFAWANHEMIFFFSVMIFFFKCLFWFCSFRTWFSFGRLSHPSTTSTTERRQHKNSRQSER